MSYIDISTFGQLADGRTAYLYTLSNDKGMSIKISNYGGIITSIKVPKSDREEELVLGFDTLEEYLDPRYLENYPYLGATIGRVSNRIRNAKFSLNGEEVQTPNNLGSHCLHGGNEGFDKKLWHVEILEEKKALKFIYISKDGEEGFPGTLSVGLIFQLTEDNELKVSYHAVSSKPTPVNLTNHTYFNLSENDETILEHELEIFSDKILDTNEDLLPTGDFVEVKNTAYDFTKSKKINTDLIEFDNYDDSYVINNTNGKLKKAAHLYHSKNDIGVEISTNCPCIQLYTGKYINTMGEKKHTPFAGVALETQEYTDAVNVNTFPSVILNPGDEYNRETVYKFSF